ncbi:Uncharacterised protein [Yersinia frederiksenii]|nr:Uncharacterised protein [Yersinia frederiksenii]
MDLTTKCLSLFTHNNIIPSLQVLPFAFLLMGVPHVR